MTTAFAIGALASAFLSVFYLSVRHHWPENYSSVKSTVDLHTRYNGFRYVLFRIAPVYLTAVFAAVTARRLGTSVPATLTTLLYIHLAVTNGLAAARLIAGTATRRATLLLYHTAVSLLCVLSTVVAAATYRSWDHFIPEPRELAAVLWTGVFAAVAAIFIQRITRVSDDDRNRLSRARQDIGSHLWAYAAAVAERCDCDQDLVRAILASESLVRPRWLRGLEQVKGRLIPTGSYGVAQIQSQHPISDEQSIQRLCERLAGYYPERRQGFVLRSRLAARLEEHNSGSQFIESVIDLYGELQPSITAAQAVARDDRPVIEVQEVVRNRHRWLIRGTASVYEGNLLVTTDNGEGDVRRAHATASTAAPRRGEWHLELPLEVRSLWLTDERMEEDPTETADARTVHLDLTDP